MPKYRKCGYGRQKAKIQGERVADGVELKSAVPMEMLSHTLTKKKKLMTSVGDTYSVVSMMSAASVTTVPPSPPRNIIAAAMSARTVNNEEVVEELSAEAVTESVTAAKTAAAKMTPGVSGASDGFLCRPTDTTHPRVQTTAGTAETRAQTGARRPEERALYAIEDGVQALANKLLQKGVDKWVINEVLNFADVTKEAVDQCRIEMMRLRTENAKHLQHDIVRGPSTQVVESASPAGVTGEASTAQSPPTVRALPELLQNNPLVEKARSPIPIPNTMASAMSELKVLQLNCQRSFAVMCSLGTLLVESAASCAMVQEPYATDGCVTGLPMHFRVFPDARVKAAVIVCDEAVDCVAVRVDQWGVCVCVEGAFGKMFLASIYCAFGAPIEPYLMFMHTVLLLADSTPVIMGLDANASSPLWFSKGAGRASGQANWIRGDELSDWILQNNLNVLNEPSEWFTFNGPMGQTDIDLSLGSSATLDKFQVSWEVQGQWGLSDHNVIEILAHPKKSMNNVKESGILRRRTQRANGKSYTRLVQEMVEISLDEFKHLNVDQQIKRLESWVNRANESLPGACRHKSPASVKSKRELVSKRKLLRQLHQSYNKARATGSTDVERAERVFRTCLLEYKSMILQSKERKCRKFIGEIGKDPWRKVYRLCGGRRKVVDISKIRVGESTLPDWEACAGVLLRTFFPQEGSQLVPQTPTRGIPLELRIGEVERAISLMKTRKVPGLDGISGEMVKVLWTAIPDYLMALYTKCVHEGYFPTAWKAARVVPLLKSPDNARSKPSSYEAICLVPVLGKVLERIMVDRLQETVATVASDRQFGFRKGQCVYDAWSHVMEVVERSQAKYVLGLFVHFKGVFENLSWSCVLERLNEIGCREIKLWHSYFSNRRACMIGERGRVWMNVVRGRPRGSVCGPLVSKVILDALLSQLELHCEIVAYADELLILVEGQSRMDLERTGTKMMDMVWQWQQSVGMGLSMEESAAMLLKGTLSRNRPPWIKVGKVAVKYKTKVKYLGITVAERFGFMPHLSCIREQILGVAGQLRHILRSDWGLTKRAFRTVYSDLLVACATYGAPIWWKVVTTVMGKRKILSCQRVILLACLPVCRTVSTDALQVLMGMPPLDLEVIRISLAFRMKRGLPLFNTWVGDDWRRWSASQRNSALKKCVRSKWSSRWHNSENGRITYAFIRDVSFVENNPDFNFSLGLGYLLTGHGSLNAFLHKRRLAESEKCACGAASEDAMHVLCECPLYDDIRNLQAMGVKCVNGRYDVGSALQSHKSIFNLSVFAQGYFHRRRRDVVAVRQMPN